MLIDSNVIIEAFRSDGHAYRSIIKGSEAAVSIISYVEVLGFPRLRDDEREALLRFFNERTVLPLTDAIAENAVAFRRLYRMKLADSVIAATALVHNLTIVTRDRAGFSSLVGVAVRVV